jgi:TolA-binding protein
LIFFSSAFSLSPDMSDLSSAPLPLGEIVQGPSAFEQFLDRHQKTLAFASVAVALSIGGFMVYRTIQADEALEAGHALYAASDVASLQKVTSDFAQSPAAATAALAAADLMAKNGQVDEAITALREVVTKYPSHPAAALAQQSLGLRLLAQGKIADAKSAFEAVLARSDARYLAAAATLSLGDIAKSENNLTAAEECYRSISRDFPDSPFVATATERLKFLSFQSPTEIDPPPAIEEPPASLALPDSADDKASSGNPLIDGLNQKKKK